MISFSGNRFESICFIQVLLRNGGGVKRSKQFRMVSWSRFKKYHAPGSQDMAAPNQASASFCSIIIPKKKKDNKYKIETIPKRLTWRDKNMVMQVESPEQD